MKKKNKQPTPEQIQKRQQRALRKKIENMFADMGFLSFKSEGRTFKLGGRENEIDHMFVQENIVILCEDTISTKHDHVRTKNETMRIINEHRQGFFEWADQNIEGFAEKHASYPLGRIQLIYLYITDGQETFTESEKQEFSQMHLWGRNELEYFKWHSTCIKQSARYELYDSLGIKYRQIGPQRGARQPRVIETPIIYPTNFMGLPPQSKIVTFMMSASDMLQMCFVLRKDGWRTTGGLYQRLIDKSKMKAIRRHLIKKQISFYNNIIVSLPKDVKVSKADGTTVSLLDVEPSFGEQGISLCLPEEYNSLCIIDGQHRVYAYHEGGVHDDVVNSLREERHLLVTGIAFPKSMSDADCLKHQSEIFLDINKNAKPIAPDLLLYIQKLQNPLADTSIAQDVLQGLNNNGVFTKEFQRSPLDSQGMKTASIVKFALRYLVSVDKRDNAASLYHYWDGEKTALEKGDAKAMQRYVSFCVERINRYFSCIKTVFNDQWHGERSLLPSVVTINGFLIVYRRILSQMDPKSEHFFRSRFPNWKTSFARDAFGYRSSQYNRFANDMLKTAFCEICREEIQMKS